MYHKDLCDCKLCQAERKKCGCDQCKVRQKIIDALTSFAGPIVARNSNPELN